MLDEKVLASSEGNSKLLEMPDLDPGSTKLITRRSFLKTFIGTAAGLFFFGFSTLTNSAKIVSHQPALAVADEVKPPKPLHLSLNKPFANALIHIETPTYDRSGQSVHPSVTDFKTEYGLESWGGFRYWMALTPYPNFNSAFENPSLLVSQDGSKWNNPPGVKSPLVPKPFGLINRNYNSDPDLVYDPDQNTLILYWREYSDGVFEKIWAIKIN